MKLLGWLTVLSLSLLVLFAAFNWAALTTPVTLSFLAFTAEGPLGLILFGATLVVVALFGVYALSLSTTALLETRRHIKALDTQRQLADTAEASRFTALGARLEQEFRGLRESMVESQAAANQRIDALQATTARAMSETASEIVANIAQIDDKLNRIDRGS